MAIGLPVKANYAAGDILTATNMNDLSGTFNNVATSYGNAAGKNKIINGDFSVWQRGTTFNNAAAGFFSADRYFLSFDGSGATRNVTQQTFTTGTAPQAGYEGKFFMRIDQTVAGTGGTFNSLVQTVENVRTFAGQTVTFSFWAKANANVTLFNVPAIQQIFGTGGSPSATVSTAASGTAAALTTSWQRFTYQVTLPSIAGKTIGTDGNDRLSVSIRLLLNTVATIDIWGVQLEAGSIATPFQTASGGSIQGELAMCQRYYVRYNATNIITGTSSSTTVSSFALPLPNSLRAAPSAIEQSGMGSSDGASFNSGGTWAIVASDTNAGNVKVVRISYTHGSAVFTQFRPAIIANTDANSFFALTSEL